MEDSGHFNRWWNNAKGREGYSKEHCLTPASGNLVQYASFNTNRINSPWNCLQVQQDHMAFNKAALTIQAFYRGYRVRRALHSQTFTGPLKIAEGTPENNHRHFDHFSVSYSGNTLHKNDWGYPIYWERPMEESYQHGTAQHKLSPDVFQEKNITNSDQKEHPTGRLTQYQHKSFIQTPAIMDKCYWDNYPYTDERIENHAATIIQAVYRGFMVRKLLFELKLATIVIQSFWRGYATRKKIALLNHFASFIQAHGMGNSTQEHHKLPDGHHEHVQFTNKFNNGRTLTQKCKSPKVSNEENTFPEYVQSSGLQFKEPSRGAEGRTFRRMHCHWSDNPGKVGNDTQMASLPIVMMHTDHPTGHLINEHAYKNWDVFIHLDTTYGAKQPSRDHRIRRRKSREQLRKENLSAAKIQSSWKSYQVRKEIKEMNKAATKIQALYRGFKVRQELQLDNDKGASHGWITISTSQNALDMGLRPMRRADPQKSVHQTGYGYQDTLGSKNQTRSGYDVAAHNRCCESPNTSFGEDDYQHTGNPCVVNSCSFRPFNMADFTPRDASCHASSNQHFRTRSRLHENYTASRDHAGWKWHNVRKQLGKAHEAAKKIQACYRGYKTRSLLKQTHLSSFERQQEAAGDAETYPMVPHKKGSQLQRMTHGTFAERENNHTSKCTGSPTCASPIRNINVSTIVKDMQSSRCPPISIRVSSPNGMVQGYYKDTTHGAQGHFTIKIPSTKSPSKVMVNVNMLNRK